MKAKPLTGYEAAADKYFYIKEAYFEAQDGKQHKIRSVSREDIEANVDSGMDVRLKMLGDENEQPVQHGRHAGSTVKRE